MHLGRCMFAQRRMISLRHFCIWRAAAAAAADIAAADVGVAVRGVWRTLMQEVVSLLC